MSISFGRCRPLNAETTLTALLLRLIWRRTRKHQQWKIIDKLFLFSQLVYVFVYTDIAIWFIAKASRCYKCITSFYIRAPHKNWTTLALPRTENVTFTERTCSKLYIGMHALINWAFIESQTVSNWKLLPTAVNIDIRALCWPACFHLFARKKCQNCIFHLGFSFLHNQMCLL